MKAVSIKQYCTFLCSCLFVCFLLFLLYKVLHKVLTFTSVDDSGASALARQRSSIAKEIW